jgi:hypothetical protein
MKRMNMSRVRPFVLPVLAAVVIGAVTFDFSSRSLTPVREETNRIAQQAETVRKQTVQGRAAQMDDARISTANARAVAKLPNDPKLAEVIDQIDALARANKLQWTAGAPAATPVTDENVPSGLYAWSMAASFSGPIAGMYRFLNELDNIERLVGVQSFALQLAGSDYTGSFVLRFYALGA